MDINTIFRGTINVATNCHTDFNSQVDVAVKYNRELLSSVKVAREVEGIDNIDNTIIVNPLVQTFMNGNVNVWKGSAFTIRYTLPMDVIKETIEVDEIEQYLLLAEKIESIGGDIEANIYINILVPETDKNVINGTIKIDRYYAQTYTIYDKNDNIIYSGQVSGDITDIINDNNDNIGKIESTSDMNAELDVIPLKSKTILGSMKVVIPAFDYELDGDLINCTIETIPSIIEDIDCEIIIKHASHAIVYYDSNGNILEDIENKLDHRIDHIDYTPNLEIHANVELAAKITNWVDCYMINLGEAYEEFNASITILVIANTDIECAIEVTPPGGSYAFIL